jgi:hypothetical protein
MGAGGLNFSVRDGKRWGPAAMATCHDVNGFGHVAILLHASRIESSGSHPARKGRRKDQVTRPISTTRLNTLLCVHLSPINVLVSDGPEVRVYLEVGFALRCFQRLSDPNIATQPCRWRDNWYTRGSSTPVLSYLMQLLSTLIRPRRIGTELSHDVLNPAHVPL